MYQTDPIRGKQDAPKTRSRSWERLSTRVRAFGKCASGAVAVEDVVWIPLFAALLILSMYVSLTLHGYNAMWDWARDSGQGTAIVGTYSADVVNASQTRLDEGAGLATQRW